MSEIAEMMLDGTMCECCGEYLPGEGSGIPRYCSSQCARDRGALYPPGNPPPAPNPKKMNCPVCAKRVKIAGLADHMRDAHGDTIHARKASHD